MDPDLFDLGNGVDEVRCFVDSEHAAVMAKVISAGLDPVEFTSHEARQLASALTVLADRLDAYDA